MRDQWLKALLKPRLPLRLLLKLLLAAHRQLSRLQQQVPSRQGRWLQLVRLRQPRLMETWT